MMAKKNQSQTQSEVAYCLYCSTPFKRKRKKHLYCSRKHGQLYQLNGKTKKAEPLLRNPVDLQIDLPLVVEMFEHNTNKNLYLISIVKDELIKQIELKQSQIKHFKEVLMMIER